MVRLGAGNLTHAQWGYTIPRMWMRSLLVLMILVLSIDSFARIPPRSQRGPRDMLLVAGGDVAYPRGWMDRLVERQKAAMFDNVRGYALAAELAFVNLESPYTDAEFFLQKRWPIATAPHRLDYVLRGGFNMFSLANNHMYDCGEPGIRDTLALLEQKREQHASGTLEQGMRKHLFWAGVSLTRREVYEPTVFKVPGKNLTVAFHAFGFAGTNLVGSPLSARALSKIREHAPKVDVTIVSVHHGKEYRHAPKSGRAALYRKYIDAGADVVLGHHPHVIQGVEVYKEGIIFHSLGNFSFASKTRRHHRTGAKLYGMLPLIYFKDGRVERAEILPLYVNNSEPFEVDGQTLRPTNFKPQIVTGVFAQQVLTDLKAWTADIPGIARAATRAFRIRGDRAIIQVRR